MSRARSRRQAALAPIAEDEPVQAEEQPGPVAEIMALIDGLDAAGERPGSRGPKRGQPGAAPDSPPFLSLPAVEERVASLMSAAEDAVLQLKHECKRLLVLLPAKVRQQLVAAAGGRGARAGCQCSMAPAWLLYIA